MRLLLGVSGGIAAYKALETARLAVRRGHSVRVVQTLASERFVGHASFAAITGAPVLTSTFELDPARGAFPGEDAPAHAPINHLGLVERAEVYLIAPASANTVAKLAAGLADDLLTTAALAADCPVAVAPAMNDRMYANPATRANIELLRSRGIVIIGPDEGALASHGEHGVGRLSEPAELLDACERLCESHALTPWAGMDVLVTAGGTREPIDSVRFIGNRSSGRMGYALAAQARARGAAVTLIAANVTISAPAGVRVLNVRTAAELAIATQRESRHAQLVLMAAAVADFRPASPVAHKLKKADAQLPRSLELVATEDVLAAVAAARAPGQVIVGFAAEHGGRAEAYGRAKLAGKSLDAIVINDISRADIGFDAVDNEVIVLTRDGRSRKVPKASKLIVAGAILDEVERLRTGLA